MVRAAKAVRCHILIIADEELGRLARLARRLAQGIERLEHAAQAIEGHGTITIRTGYEGERVYIEISDTGAGIPAENMKRIFDPFFTTKPVGKGTGLGLSLSFGIVEKHHGRIEVKSEVGSGTTFRIWLPVKQNGDGK